jgi:hypothetical protein
MPSGQVTSVREESLPRWARDLIGDLRSQLAHLRTERDEAVEVAELARGATNPDTAMVAVEADITDGPLVGIPGDRPVVYFRNPDNPNAQAGEIAVSRQQDGSLLIEAFSGALHVLPRDAASVRVMVVSLAEHRRNRKAGPGVRR